MTQARLTSRPYRRADNSDAQLGRDEGQCPCGLYPGESEEHAPECIYVLVKPRGQSTPYQCGPSETWYYFRHVKEGPVCFYAGGWSTPQDAAWVGRIFDVTRFPSREVAYDVYRGVFALSTPELRRQIKLVKVTVRKKNR